MGGGSPPQAPTPPQPPKPSPAPSAPISDFPGLAKKLAKQLKDKKDEDVRRAVSALSPSDRVKLEAVLGATLGKDRLKPQGIELRRIIRFFQRPSGKTITPTPFTMSGGTAVDLKNSKIADGKVVSAKTGVKASVGAKSKIAYALTYTGSDAGEMKWLQMIWRDVTLNFPASGKDKARSVAFKKRFDHLARQDMPYFASTHPDHAKNGDKCRWQADCVSVDEPFYEHGSPVKRLNGELTMMDDPSPSMLAGEASTIFGQANAPESIVAGFHAETYLVHGLDVLYRVTIDISWKLTKSAPGADGTINIRGAPASAITGAQRARVAIENPDTNFLPGPQMPAPLWGDDLDPIKDLAPGDWSSLTKDVEKVSSTAWAANIGMVPYMKEVNPSDRINLGKPYAKGLNYDGLMVVDGETGFIDSTNKYTGAFIPTDRLTMPPNLALVLGKPSLHVGTTDFPKEAAVGTLRHEMQHVQQAAYAIGWLVKWQDDLTALNFESWLKTQKLSTVDRLIVEGYINNRLGTIETLGWTEGLVAAIPFLPAAVDVSLLKVKEQWPAALRELRGAGDKYTALNMREADVKPLAIDRIRRYLCEFATNAQRDTFILWVKAVMDPAKLTPAPDAETIKLVKSFFDPQSQWLKDVLAIAQKPCPK